MYLYQHFGIELARDLHRERLAAAERFRLAKELHQPHAFTFFRKRRAALKSQAAPKPSPIYSVKPIRI